MQVRCMHCGVPYALSKETIHAALDAMAAEDMKFTEMRCPKCRKPNRVSRQQLERAAPDWQPSAEVPSASA